MVRACGAGQRGHLMTTTDRDDTVSEAGPVVSDELIEELMARVDAEGVELLGPDGVLNAITSRLMNRALDVELTEHLGYERGDPGGRGSGNSRNGSTAKTLVTDAGEVPIRTPRDRNGSFDPKLVPKRQRRLEGFNDLVIGLVARGMTVRDTQAHLQDIYGVEISAELISKITNEVMDEARAWQNRPLDAVYPILYLDAIVVKVRDSGVVVNRPVYVALGVDLDGRKHVLGLWLGKGDEGAKFWLSVLTELRNRGVRDVLIACCDGLSGFGDAIETVWPATTGSAEPSRMRSPAIQCPAHQHVGFPHHCPLRLATQLPPVRWPRRVDTTLTTRCATSFGASCSQARSTSQPCSVSASSTSRSRATLRSSFGSQ